MKKMMIVAALAASSLAGFAGICDGEVGPGPDPVKASQRVYDFKANVKLVDGKSASATIKTAGTICNPGSSSTSMAYYRVKSSRTFKGIFLDCDVCQIDAVQKGEVEAVDSNKAGDNLIGSKAYFYVSSSDSKYKAVYSPAEFDQADSGYKFLVGNFVGGVTFAKSKVAEGLVQLNFAEYDKFGELRLYSLFAAGFGARDGVLIKNLSGNLAGAVSAATWCGIWTQTYEPCLATQYYDSMEVTAEGVTYTPDAGNKWQANAETSPAFDAVSGTWSVKYSAAKSKLASQDAVLRKTFGSNYWVLGGGEDAEAFVFPIAYVNIGAQE